MCLVSVYSISRLEYHSLQGLADFNMSMQLSPGNSSWLLCRRDYHEELAALMLYMVKEGCLDTARDTVLIMLVNK